MIIHPKKLEGIIWNKNHDKIVEVKRKIQLGRESMQNGLLKTPAEWINYWAGLETRFTEEFATAGDVYQAVKDIAENLKSRNPTEEYYNLSKSLDEDLKKAPLGTSTAIYPKDETSSVIMIGNQVQTIRMIEGGLLPKTATCSFKFSKENPELTQYIQTVLETNDTIEDISATFYTVFGTKENQIAIKLPADKDSRDGDRFYAYFDRSNPAYHNGLDIDTSIFDKRALARSVVK